MDTIWKFDDRVRFRSGSTPSEVTLDAATASSADVPAELSGPGRDGCHRLRLLTTLKPGVYRLDLAFQEPTRRIDFWVFLDGRMVATNAVYFDGASVLDGSTMRTPCLYRRPAVTRSGSSGPGTEKSP